MDEAELTPALERVAASVVETHRKRQQVEEELRAAASAVATLHAQSASLEASVRALRHELDQALRLRSAEDSALADLAAKRAAAVEQLAVIGREIESLLAEGDRVAGDVRSQSEEVRPRLHSVEGEVASVKTVLGGFATEAAALRESLAGIRKSADAIEGQLGETQSKVRELDGAMDGMAARVCVLAEALDGAERDRQRIAGATDELRSVVAMIETRKADARRAAAESQTLLEAHQRQTRSLAGQIERLAAVAGEQQAGAAPSPDGSAAAQPAIPSRSRAQAASPQPAAQAAEAQPAAKAPPPERRPHDRRAGRNDQSHFARTVELAGVLVPLGFIGHDEAEQALEILRAGDVDKFVRTLWSRAMGGPLPAPYRLFIGSALAEAGDHKGAVSFLNKALEGRHLDPFVTYLVALALLHMKRYVDVLHIAQALGRTKHGKVLSRNIEALHAGAGGRLDEAERKLTEALAVPGHPRVHHHETLYNLARLAQERGDPPAAAAWFEKLAAADASYRDAALRMDAVQAASAGV